MFLRRLVLTGIVLTLATRFLLLNQLPAGVSHDEAEYVLSSAAYAYIGTDLSGIGFPLSLIKTDTHGRISPIPPLLLAPYFYFVPITQLSARIPYIIISILTVFILYLLSIQIFRNKSLALIVALLFSTSPWGFFLSRWAGDTPLALLFFLLGIYLNLSNLRGKFFSSFIFFVLGFFSYNGAKILFLPLIILLLVYKWKIEKISWFHRRWFIVSTLTVCVFFVGYFVISYITPGSIVNSRESEIVFLNKALLDNQVNYLREQAFDSSLNHFFINKYSIALSIVAEKYLTAFSPIPLFVSGDPDTVFRTNVIGLLPLYEIFTLIIGILVLYKSFKKEFWLLFGLVAVAPLATAFSSNATSLLQRSFLLLPFFSVIAGVGVYYSYLYFSRFADYRLVATLWGGVIGLFFVAFLHFYFFQWPMLGLEGFTLQNRLGMDYLRRISPDSRTEVISTNNRLMFLQYVFFSGKSVQQRFFNEQFDSFLKKDYAMGMVSFSDHCPDSSTAGITYVIQREASPCKRLGIPNAEVISKQDQKMLWQVHEDPLCDRIALSSNKTRPQLLDFDFIEMSDERFCKTWVNN